MINPINTYTPVNQSSSSGKTAKSSEQAQMFKNILDGATENLTGSNIDTNALQSLGEISPMSSSIMPDSSGILQTHTEDLLAKLEKYSNQMQNPAISLKEIESLVNDIYTNAQDLLNETKSLEDETGGDPELMDIASQFAITAQSEYIKFQRGDYI